MARNKKGPVMKLKPFIVNKVDWLFEWLRSLTLSELLSQRLPAKEQRGGFVELWVIVRSITAIVFLAASRPEQVKCWEWLMILWGAYSVYEIIVHQTNVLLFDAVRANKLGEKYNVISFRRSVILLIMNYFEVSLWFALFYRNAWHLFRVTTCAIKLNSFFGSIYYSLVTMSTLGYGDITPVHPWGSVTTVLQTLIGLFIMLCVLTHFIALLPKPESDDKNEQPQKK